MEKRNETILMRKIPYPFEHLKYMLELVAFRVPRNPFFPI